jgi:uracil-DNA glycosylase family 4
MIMAVRPQRYPGLDSPGCPPAGPDFVRLAEGLGDDPALLDQLYRRALFERFSLPVQVKRSLVPAVMLPGHLWGGRNVAGPVPADFMVVGKWPGTEELRQLRNLAGPSGDLLRECLYEAGFGKKEPASWYVTNLVKHQNVDPGASRVPSAWLKNGLPLLHQELLIVRPLWLLCLGVEAGEAVLGQKVKIADSHGLTFVRDIPAWNDEPEYQCKVVVVTHPAYVLREPTARKILVEGLAHFRSVVCDLEKKKAEQVQDYRVVYYEDELAEIVDMVIARGGPAPIIVVDTEWHGQHPLEKNAWLRTFQFSDRAGFACCVVLRQQGSGNNLFAPHPERVVPHLRRLFEITPGRKVRLAGHHLRADLPWVAKHLDHDLASLMKELYEPAESPELARDSGGLDTMYMAHAIRETGFLEGFKLEFVCQALLGVRRWNIGVEQWKHDYCADRGIKVKDLGGYGDVPDEVLFPYACADVAVPRQLIDRMIEPGGMLDRDDFGCSSWPGFWRSMRSSLALLEMEETGIYVDREVATQLTQLYESTAAALLEELRHTAGWPDFNPDSGPDCRELLFGENFAGRKEAGARRPPGALSLSLEPVKTTGKPSKPWVKVRERGQEALYNPACDKETLGILRDQHPAVNLLRRYRFIRQVLKMTLRPPVASESEVDDQDFGDEEGWYYDGGLMKYVQSDGRIYTHLFPTTETARLRSARPNLQNISNRRESDYVRELGERYLYPIRAILAVTPAGPDDEDDPWCLVDFDIKGAELLLAAIQSCDPVMLDHCLRNILDEKDPNYFDIHSNTAVSAFRLKCAPTKKALKDAGVVHLRVAAKCVVSGSRLHTTQGWVSVEQFAGHLQPDEAEEYTGSLGVVNHVGATPIVGVYNGGIKPCLRVVTEDGYELESTYTHRYWVVDEEGNFVFRQADALKPGDWVCIRTAVGPFGSDVRFPENECLPRISSKPINFPAEFNEDWCAFLGLYVSEGCVNPDTGYVQIVLAHEDDAEFVMHSRGLLRRLFGSRVRESNKHYEDYQDQTKFVINSVALARWLARYFPGKAATKRLPDFVFCWPRALLAVFLRWLFEGNGSAVSHQQNFIVKYDTASRQLAFDVQTLLLLFGVVCRTENSTRAGYDGTYYTLRLKTNRSRKQFTDLIGFLTAGKHGRCVNRAEHPYDRAHIPRQLDRLAAIFPGTHNIGREKCRECLREHKRVALNRTRLRQIVESVNPLELDEAGLCALVDLRKLAGFDISYQRVEKVEEIGLHQVYDVQTTPDQHHLVSYNGLLTHQTVAFGTMYGRGDEAIVREVLAEGVKITVEEAAQIRAGLFGVYQHLLPYFERCQKRVLNPGHLTTCFGRRRRFPICSDREIIAKLQREAQNMPIQSAVADLVHDWMHLLYHHPERRDSRGRLRFRMLLQMHDALMVECRASFLERFEAIIHETLATLPVYACDLDGNRLPGAEPHYMSTDVGVFRRWGVKLTAEDAALLRVPAHYLEA